MADLVVDGICGPMTRSAIEKFQAEFSVHSVQSGLQPLEQDGIVTRADNFGFDVEGGKYAAYTIVAMNLVVHAHAPRRWANLPFDPRLPIQLRLQLLHATT
ncbi:MAG: hypothetical protein HYS04_00325 [Acidobacteria bacterium]|nr:hypothetical protein [Acidobacteriota bacterium]